MGRYVILDGFRGFFLIFMAVAHFNGLIGSWLGALHHKNFGWVEDAQGFVFISGLVVGLVYGRKFLRRPKIAESFRLVLARARQLYTHQVALILMALTGALALGATAPVDLMPYLEAPATFTISSLLLVSSSANMGILPMYIVFLLATPLALRMLHRDQIAPYFALMLLLWLAAQTSLTGVGMYQLQKLLVAEGVPASFGLFFNLLGWQVLFFGGLFAGFRLAQGRLDLEFLDQPQYRTTFFIALAGAGLLGFYDLVVELRLMGETYTQAMLARSPRTVLGVIYPVAFLADLFIVVWLLRVGPKDRLTPIRKAAAGLRWLFTRPSLVLLGRHSLQVFSFHIVVYYLLAVLLSFYDPSAAARTALLLGAVASLYLAALGRSWWINRAAAGAAIPNR